MPFEQRHDGEPDGSDVASDDQGGGPRLDRRQMLVGLAGGGLAGLAGCMEEIDDNDFEADPVSIPLEELERLGLEQVAEDEIVFEEERTIDDEDVSAEMTSHVVGYEATGEAGGEAQFQTTRDVGADEVLVMIPGEAILDADEDVVGELSEVGRLILPGEMLVGEDGMLQTGEYPITPTATDVFFPGGLAGPFEEHDLDELQHAIEDDVMPPHEGILLPKRGLLSEDLQAVPFEALVDALDQGVSEEQVGRLLENSVLTPGWDHYPDEEGMYEELLEEGVVMVSGTEYLPWDDILIPEDTVIDGDFADGDTFVPGWQDVTQEDALFVEGTGGIENHHEIEVGRLELLEAGGFILPAGSWEGTAADVIGFPFQRLFGTEGGYVVPGSAGFLTGPVPYLEGDAPLDTGRMALLVPDGSIGKEMQTFGSQAFEPGEMPMVLFHRSALDGEVESAPLPPGIDHDEIDYTGDDERIDLPLPDGETTFDSDDSGYGFELPADLDSGDTFHLSQGGFVVSVEDFFGGAFDYDPPELAEMNVAVMMPPHEGILDSGDEFTQADENWDIDPFDAGDTVDADFVVAPFDRQFDLQVEVSDHGAEFPVEEVEVGRLEEASLGVTMLVDDEGRASPMSYAAGETLAGDQDRVTLSQHAVVLPSLTDGDSGEDTILQPHMSPMDPGTFVGWLSPNRNAVFFPEDVTDAARRLDEAQVLEAGAEVPAEEVLFYFPTEVAEPEPRWWDIDQQAYSWLVGDTTVGRLDVSASPAMGYEFDEHEPGHMPDGHGFEPTAVVEMPAGGTFSRPDVEGVATRDWSPGVPDYSPGVPDYSPGVPDYARWRTGAFATPRAEVMGEPLNPLVDKSTPEILTSGDELTGRLSPWPPDDLLRGPERLGSTTGRLFGEEAGRVSIETYAAIAGSEEDPEFGVSHVGRLETDGDLVFVTGTSTWDVDDVGPQFVGDDGYVTEDELEASAEAAAELFEAFEQE